MKKAKYFVFILSLLAFVWSEVSMNHDGIITGPNSENRTESESQPNTSFLSIAIKSIGHKKIDPETHSPFDHFNAFKTEANNEMPFNRTSKLFIAHRQLLL